MVASALAAAAEKREDELVNLTGPRVYHWQVHAQFACCASCLCCPVFLELRCLNRMEGNPIGKVVCITFACKARWDVVSMAGSSG